MKNRTGRLSGFVSCAIGRIIILCTQKVSPYFGLQHILNFGFSKENLHELSPVRGKWVPRLVKCKNLGQILGFRYWTTSKRIARKSRCFHRTHHVNKIKKYSDLGIFDIFMPMIDWDANNTSVALCNTSIMHELWTLNHEVWSMKYEVWSMKHEVWSMKYEVWSTKYEVWSMKYEVWSMKYEV